MQKLASFTIVALIVLGLSGFGLISHAQYNSINLDDLLNDLGAGTQSYSGIIDEINSTGASPISLNAYPLNPKPGETVRATVKSYSMDLDRSTITWRLGSKVLATGIGEKSVSFQAGTTGSSQTLTVSVSSTSGQATQSVTFSPAEVDLIWEAKSYTPPFYKGKALMPYQSNVVITAMPASSIDPNKLIYTWKEDGKTLGSMSGYGKKKIEVQTGVIMKPINVSVVVSSQDGTYSATGKLSINMVSPEPVFYVNSQLLGIQFHYGIDRNILMKNNEMKLKVIPYYFSNPYKHTSPVLGYKWSINGIGTGREGDQNLTVRHPDTAGSSQVSVKIENSASILQYSTPSIIINY